MVMAQWLGSGQALAKSGAGLLDNVRLTPKEAALLALLMHNPGQCFSREMLLRSVWGYEEGTRTRTVDAHIQRLRTKLGQEGHKRIRTVLKNGYFWATED